MLAVDAGVFTPSSYDDATVTVTDEDGSRLATVDVRVADTFQKRYTGLSDTASLADGEGMLFVHDRPGTHAYVMRDMAFPLDILFVDENGTVTTVHHAELPSSDTADSDLRRYRGYGVYVLEVPHGYTNRTGIDAGDTVTVDGLD
ncbi:DUF192 domain-containing protein [Halobaculum sp. MBLA0143]|uniref:DUF192 domain-containing protein n=1 Tax=Halobaculum sp. MBLA0143 TaxID=3079933 RepID=UPI003525481D